MTSFGEDFSFDNGVKKKAAVKFAMSVIVIVVIPILLIRSLEYIADTETIDPGVLVSELEKILRRLILFGLPLIVLKTLVAFYPKGNYARLTFGIASKLYGALCIVIITNRGLDTIDATELANSILSSETIEITGAVITFETTGLMTILILLALIGLIIPIAQFKCNRADYIEENKERNGPDETYTRHKPVK